MEVVSKTKAELMAEIDELRAQLKEAEKKLSAIPEPPEQPSETMSRLILDQATDMTLVCDENGKITRASQVAHRYAGGKILLGKPFDGVLKLRFFSPHPLQKEVFSVLEVLNGKILRREEVILQREGEAFHFLLSARPLTDQHGRIHGCVVTLTDITPHKQMEEELHKSRHALEIRVQERTAELAKVNEELRAEIAERKRTEEALRKLTDDLNERVKEINCLYSISYYIDKHYLLMEEKLKNIVNLIPSGWQYPEITCGRIVLEGKEYKTDNFRETPWKLSSDIIVHDEKIGIIEVFHLEKKPEAYEGAFLKEERGLINAIAIELGEMNAHMRAEKALHAASLYTRSLIEASLDPLVTISADGKVMDVNEALELVTGVNRKELIGSDFSDYFTDPARAKEGYQKVFTDGLVRDYPLAIRHTSGKVIDVLYNATVYKSDAGEVQGILAAARDITELKEAQTRAEAINSLLNLFVRKSRRKKYLDSVIELIQPWSGCRCVGIRILNEKDYVPYESYVGFDREFWESENLLSIKYDQCACIRVVTGNPDPQDKPVMTPVGSFRCENTFEFVGSLSEEEKARFRGVCIKNGFKSVAIVPIRYGERILGVIHLADEGEGKVTLNRVQFIESMAPLIGEAVIRFNLEEELKNSEMRLRHLSSQLLTVQENERKRIAVELHDSIGQMLTAIKFKIESILQGKNKKKSLEALIPLVRETIDEARRIQMDLRPSTLDDIGVLATLDWFCREYQKIYSHIRIEKKIGLQESEVSASLKTAIYRLTQEALNNIAKHSKADLIFLSLQTMKDTIELVIKDNGTGFSVEEILSSEKTKKGLGLNSMRERTELSGGTFAIETAPGAGTMIRANWPL
jgi:PAS domain S-box-containing protein